MSFPPTASPARFAAFQNQPVLQGALLILFSELMFASMGASIKALSLSDLSNEMTVFLRNLLGLFLVLPLLLKAGVGSFRTCVLPLHLLRTVSGLSAMYCLFYAVSHLPLADAMLLKMTTPIFMPLLVYLWLRERVSRWALLAIPLGFGGVIVILQPQGTLHLAALVGLLGGLCEALAKTTVRRLSCTEPTLRIVFYFALFATFLSLLPLWLSGWQMPSWAQWQFIALIALFGSLGQLLMTQGYSTAPAAQISPLTFFAVVFGASYGYLFWQEMLDLRFVSGAVLISLAGILAVRR